MIKIQMEITKLKRIKNNVQLLYQYPLKMMIVALKLICTTGPGNSHHWTRLSTTTIDSAIPTKSNSKATTSLATSASTKKKRNVSNSFASTVYCIMIKKPKTLSPKLPIVQLGLCSNTHTKPTCTTGVRELRLDIIIGRCGTRELSFGEKILSRKLKCIWILVSHSQ